VRRSRWAGSVGGWLTALLISGCASTVKEIRRHPQQERLDRILAAVLPHTSDPTIHYWLRVSEASSHPVGLAALPQRHVYLAEPLVQEADEAILAALVAHGVAHHRLHHYAQRNAINVVQRGAFKAGGFFVPGLGHGHYLGGPLLEVALSAGQEPQADAKTVAYLRGMGYAQDDLLHALEWLETNGYSELVGHVRAQGADFTNRIDSLRRHPVPQAHSGAADSP